jgi:hypothetical protein
MENKKIKFKIFNKNSLKENNKANLPITIFVIGVIAICILTIFSFVFSIGKISSKNWGFELMEEVKVDLEKFYFYKNIGFSDEESAEKINARVLEEEIEGELEEYLIIKKSSGEIAKDRVLVTYKFALKR